jgi:uncharacterized protein DUF4166
VPPGKTEPLYESLVGPAWDALPASVRRAHLGAEGLEAAGVLRVERGSGRAARVLARLCRLPEAGESVPVRLSVRREGPGERWVRSFGARRLVSSQHACADGLLAERFGPLELRFRLAPTARGLRYEQGGTALCAGPLHLPLPRWMAPRVTATEEAAPPGDRTRLRVTVSLPVVGLLLAYEGELAVEAPPW